MKGSDPRLPVGPLRSSVIRVVMVVLTAMVVLTPAVASWTMSGADYIRRVGFYAVAAILMVSRVGGHHPFLRFGAANSVTLVRMALVAGMAGLIGESPSERMEWLLVAAVVVVAVLDGVDGWLARREQQVSAFGARFDMETDAAMILILSVLVWQHGKAGLWVLACGLMRYAFVAADRSCRGWPVRYAPRFAARPWRLPSSSDSVRRCRRWCRSVSHCRGSVSLLARWCGPSRWMWPVKRQGGQLLNAEGLRENIAVNACIGPIGGRCGWSPD